MSLIENPNKLEPKLEPIERIKCSCKSKIFYLLIDRASDELIIKCHKCSRMLRFKRDNEENKEEKLKEEVSN